MKKLEDWEVLRSVYIRKTRWVNWRIDTCRLPHNHKVEDFYITEIPTSVGVVAMTPEREVILVQQYRHGIRKALLEIPGGMITAADRTPLDAARRELREETGYSSQKWTLLAERSLHPPSHENLIFIYLAVNARCTSPQKLDRGERIEVKRLPFERLLRMIQTKRFQSLGSTAAILLARQKIGMQA